jgi:POT family proton-dependent oligopeptide transporter
MPDVADTPEPTGRPVQAPPRSPAGGLRSLFNQPRGLYALFFTEMWERFSFYLMLNLLALYMTKYLNFGDERSSDIATWYLSLVYFTPFIGGLIADRLTGYVRAIVIGGLLMMTGHIVLAFDTKESTNHYFLYAALGLLICGNGMFKPNISTMVGNLYAPGDARRDQGFTLFYMGINLGAFLGPLTANLLRRNGVSYAQRFFGINLPEDAGWHVAFGSAGVGMFLSLLIFLSFQKRLRGAAAPKVQGPEANHDLGPADDGAPAAGERVLRFGQWFNMGSVAFFLAWLLLGKLIPWPDSIREVALWPTNMVNFAIIWLAIEAVTVLIFLSGGTLECANAAKLKSVFVIVALFWMAFHQNSVTLTFFADRNTDTTWDAETFGAINPAFILLFSPLMVLLWGALARRGREPSSVSKMILAMFITGLAYAVMVGAGLSGGDTGKVSPYWLVGCYALLTVAELWLSPIGLSLTSKLAPVKYRGLWMGFWFLATAVGNKLVHVIGQYWDRYPPSQLFMILVVSSVGAAVALDYILINLRRFGPPSTEA